MSSYHGKIIEWHENGELSNEWSYNENVRLDGQQFAWYENGIMKEVVNYKDGLKTGLWIYYNMKGEVINEINYEIE
ncbi:MAG: hypothetical protein IIA45_15290 [Bacteroidetes bacterium]|nr:hypothetical protein [Bacteroidota bacterium]